MFIPNVSAKSVAADFAPISASIIFFSVATIIAVKAIKDGKKPDTEVTGTIQNDTSSLRIENQMPLYDPDPVIGR